MKSIILNAITAIAIVTCLSMSVQAKSFNHLSPVSVSDTGKMAKNKMKMSKMKKDSMKMHKMMGKKKMAKDTAGKM